MCVHARVCTHIYQEQCRQQLNKYTQRVFLFLFASWVPPPGLRRLFKPLLSSRGTSCPMPSSAGLAWQGLKAVPIHPQPFREPPPYKLQEYKTLIISPGDSEETSSLRTKCFWLWLS